MYLYLYIYVSISICIYMYIYIYIYIYMRKGAPLRCWIKRREWRGRCRRAGLRSAPASARASTQSPRRRYCPVAEKQEKEESRLELSVV